MMQKQPKVQTKSFTGIFIKQNIKENKRFMNLLLILQFLGIPTILILSTIDEITRNRISYLFDDNIDILLSISAALFAVASLLGIITAIKSFSYLHKKTHADSMLALPLSSNQRFVGSYLSGLLIYTIPYIAAILLSEIVIMFYEYACGTSFILGIQGVNFLIYAGIGLLSMIMLYTTTVFTCSCCGSRVESVIYSFLLNIAIPLFIYTFNVAVYSDKIGLVPVCEAFVPLSFSASLGGVCKIILLVYDQDMSPVISGPVLLDIFLWSIKYIVIIAVLIAFSVFLYKKRKAEDISKPFVYPFIYYFFIITAVISILMFSIFNKFEVVGIILSFIMYITLDLIKTRGLNSIKKHTASFICYALSLAAAFTIIKISIATDGFGKKNFIPDENNINSIIISSNSINIYSDQMTDVVLTDKKSINQIIKMHQATLEFYKSSDTDYKTGYSYYYHTFFNKISPSYFAQDIGMVQHPSESCLVEFKYITDSGKKIFRSYMVPYAEWTDTLLCLAEDDNVKKAAADSFDNSLMVYNSFNDSRYYSNIYAKTKFNYQQYNTGINYTDTEKIRELSESYRKDIMSVTREDIMDLKTHCIIFDNYIPECFKNTIDVLDKYNIHFESHVQNEFYNYDEPVIISNSDYIKKTYQNRSDIITSSCGTPGCYALTSYDHDLFNSIIEAAEPNYYTYDDCYIINLRGMNYIIPSEYSSLAKKFIDTSKCDTIEWEIANDPYQ